jgi:hypothetical protein
MARRAKASSGASLLRRSGSRLRLLLLAALALLGLTAVALVSSASAAAPTLVMGTATNPTYTTVDVTGELNAGGEEADWNFQVSPDGGATWQETNVGGQSFGTEPEEVGGTIENLRTGTAYKVRLWTIRFVNGPEEFTSANTAEFTTETLPAQTVTIDPVSAPTATSASFAGHIEPNAPAGEPSVSEVNWHFHCEPVSCPGAEAPGPPVPAGASVEQVHAESTHLEPNTEYHVGLITENNGHIEVTAGPTTFTTEASEPIAETVPAFAVDGGTEAIIGARINPRNSPTTYWIEYGPTSDYGTAIPPSKDATAGSGGESQVLTQRITGLSPSTEYHFRAFAKNASGEVHGEDLNFETAPSGPEPPQSCPNQELREENNSTALPECRAYEQVSPTDKNGFPVALFADNGIPHYVASTDGSAITWEAAGAYGDAKSSNAINVFLARRGSAGWITHGVNPPQIASPTLRLTGFFRWFSSDLNFGVLLNPPDVTLAPDDNPESENTYLTDLRDDTYRTLAPGGSGLVAEGILASGIAIGLESGSGSSAAVHRILFEDYRPLTPDAPQQDVPGIRVIGLYEWHDGHVEYVATGTEGFPVPYGATIDDFIEHDGERLAVYTEVTTGPRGVGEIFLRRDGGAPIRITASQRATPEPPSGGIYGGMSADGSQIYFTSLDALTEDAPPGNSTPQLYRYDAATSRLSDLTASAIGHDEVIGIAGVSPDGSDVYFVGYGQFRPGENEGDGQNQSLFVWHDGKISFVGPTVGVDSGKGGRTFRLSQDGSKISFVSQGRMTAYDNAGQSEVYVYDAAAEHLTCVSCDPDGSSPTAPSTFPVPPVEANASEANFQPGVHDDGSIVFDSDEALVPGDVNGVADVYRWKDGRVQLISTGTSSAPSHYASSSATGEDIFFTTRSRLAPADTDEIPDIYDARVDGGFPGPSGGSRCESPDTCHGPEGTAPAQSAIASNGLTPEVAADPARLRLNKALKACKKKSTKKLRTRCRTNAKKRLRKTSTGSAHR